jgi:hypothetical protein
MTVPRFITLDVLMGLIYHKFQLIMKALLLTLFIFFNAIAMGQDKILIGNYGIENNLLNKNVIDFSCLTPISDLDSNGPYTFPSGDFNLYFLSRDVISSFEGFEKVDDLFIITDTNKIIRLIDIFFNSEPQGIEDILTKTFGHYRFLFESSVTRISSYIWISQFGIEYALHVQYPESPRRKVMNLTIYPTEVDDQLGEWYISKPGFNYNK